MTRAVVAGLAVALLSRYPWLAAGAVPVATVSAWRRSQARRKKARADRLDALVAGRTLLVALTGGLSLPAGLAVAAEEAGPRVGAELWRVLRLARGPGLAAALASAEGSLTRPLLTRLARAQASGAPMAEAVMSYLTEMQALRRVEALDRVRRLPVTLMIPLGLLILPGFVVLFVGPIVLTSLFDLFGSLP